MSKDTPIRFNICVKLSPAILQEEKTHKYSLDPESQNIERNPPKQWLNDKNRLFCQLTYLIF